MRQPSAIMAVLFVGFTAAAAQTAFQVNSFTTGAQRMPAIAMAPDGRFIVVWAGAAQNGSGTDIFARLFDPPADPAGLPTPLGAEFQVNTYAASSQLLPRVAVDGSGGFVVVWRSVGQDGDRGGIFGRRFDSAGLPAGGEFAVNSTTVGDQLYPDVAADGAGNFVVVWQSKDSASTFSPVDILLRRFDSTAAPLAPESVLSTETRASLIVEVSPTVAMNGRDDFVVVWSRPTGKGVYPRLYGRRFNPSGDPAGGEFSVAPGSNYVFDYQPRAGMDESGGFVVVWGRGFDFGLYFGAYARRFNPDATPRADAFPVNNFSFLIDGPDVAMSADGSFALTWPELSSPRAQRFDSAGVPAGAPVVVTSSRYYGPAVAMDATGSFTVVWPGSDGDQTGVLARRFPGSCTGPVTDLRVEPANGGADLLLTWTDAVRAEDHVIVEDTVPNGAFSTQTGTAVSGATGLTVPTPPGTTFYLVAGRTRSCGLGPLR
ncbi:MAG: hypothetical protein ACE5IK_13935 [Acidobacteriota bacterium]